MHDAASIQAIVTDILKTTRDHDVINRIQVAVGYCQLAAMYPATEFYQAKLEKAVDDLNAIIQRKAIAA